MYAHSCTQGGIFTLLYFLVDNVFSKSRLTPGRIKIWVSLLCVVTTWTVLAVYLLTIAQTVEVKTRSAVYSLNEELVNPSMSSCAVLKCPPPPGRAG